MRRLRAVSGCLALASLATAAGAPAAGASTPGPVLLLGNGVASVRFGTTQAKATAQLTTVLGPLTTRPVKPTVVCGLTAEATRPHVQLFFRGGSFVGYEVGSATASTAGAPDVATAKGLRLGDTVGQARRLYGQAFSVSSAQGGSWTARTAQGRLIGLLLQPPGARGAADRIQLIAAGYLGCPAMTP